jgi:hypothetical protein
MVRRDSKGSYGDLGADPATRTPGVNSSSSPHWRTPFRVASAPRKRGALRPTVCDPMRKVYPPNDLDPSAPSMALACWTVSGLPRVLGRSRGTRSDIRCITVGSSGSR